jgi:hypothetical protein
MPIYLATTVRLPFLHRNGRSPKAIVQYGYSRIFDGVHVMAETLIYLANSMNSLRLKRQTTC